MSLSPETRAALEVAIGYMKRGRMVDESYAITRLQALLDGGPLRSDKEKCDSCDRIDEPRHVVSMVAGGITFVVHPECLMFIAKALLDEKRG